MLIHMRVVLCVCVRRRILTHAACGVRTQEYTHKSEYTCV
jgi:hypothetical protein